MFGELLYSKLEKCFNKYLYIYFLSRNLLLINIVKQPNVVTGQTHI